MFVTLFAAALAATSTPAIDPKNPKVQTAICTARFLDNLKSVADGGVPNSLIIPLFAQQIGMSDEDAQVLEQTCDMFDHGAFFVIAHLPAASSSSSASGDEDIGESAPDNTNEPI